MRRRYATIGGTLAVCVHLARAAGPIAAAAFAARVGYEPVWWLLSILAVCCALAMFAMPHHRASGCFVAKID